MSESVLYRSDCILLQGCLQSCSKLVQGLGPGSHKCVKLVFVDVSVVCRVGNEKARKRCIKLHSHRLFRAQSGQEGYLGVQAAGW